MVGRSLAVASTPAQHLFRLHSAAPRMLPRSLLFSPPALSALLVSHADRPQPVAAPRGGLFCFGFSNASFAGVALAATNVNLDECVVATKLSATKTSQAFR